MNEGASSKPRQQGHHSPHPTEMPEQGPKQGTSRLTPPLARLTMRPYPVERAMTANALHHPTRLPLATSGCQALRNGAGALQTWMFYSVQL